MRVQVLQHAPFEDAGSIWNWLDAHGCDVRLTRLFAGQVPPTNVGDLELIVVMGGPMSVNDEETYPWLRAEKAFLREAIDSGVAVLGVCLGAQLIAAALDASVYPNPVKEIGWFPVRATAKATNETFSFPDECMAFHWHGETFDLPPGAIHLAESAGCSIQAFQIGRHVIGLQFHLEMTISGSRLLAECCAGDLAPGPYVQDERELVTADSERYAAAHTLMDRVLDYLTRDVRVAAVKEVTPQHGSEEWFDAEDPLGSAVRRVHALSSQFNWVGIYVLRGDTLEVGPFIGAPTEHTRIKVGEGVCGTAVALGRDLNVPDVTQAANYLSCSAETRSELVVLIRDRRDAIVAQIDIDSHTAAAFGEREVEAVRRIAARLGQTWEDGHTYSLDMASLKG